MSDPVWLSLPRRLRELGTVDRTGGKGAAPDSDARVFSGGGGGTGAGAGDADADVIAELDDA